MTLVSRRLPGARNVRRTRQAIAIELTNCVRSFVRVLVGEFSKLLLLSRHVVLRHRRNVLSVSAILALASPVAAQSTQSAILHVRDGARDIALTAADLGTLPRRQLRVAAENSTDSVTVSGFTLWDLLQKAGVPSPEASGRQRAATYVRLVAADGQTAFFALVEVDPGFSRKTILVSDQRNGRALDATEGPWRVFVPDELRHARWIRGLARVDVGTLPPP